jgi:hypothetical protein
MTPDEHNAWIRLKIEAELMCARIEIEGMIAENQQRAYSGFIPAYTEEAFQKVLTSHGIRSNDVQTQFQECY